MPTFFDPASTAKTRSFVVLVVVCLSLGGCGKSKEEQERAYRAELAKLQAATAASEAAAASQARQDALDKANPQAAMRRRSREALSKLSRAERLSALQAQVRDSMKDPSSVQFRNVRLAPDELALCGEVNARNAYGGYVGFRQFVVADGRVLINYLDLTSPSTDEVTMSFLFLAANKDRGCAT